MKMKAGGAIRICGGLLLLGFALSGCGTDATPSPKEAGKAEKGIDYERQIALIAEKAELWKGDEEQVTEPYFYAVTDLDQNGRLELIQSICQGTGFYTYTRLWEVNAEGTDLIACAYAVAEEESQPDVIANPDGAYFDEAQNRYYYIFRDDLRIGGAEYVQDWVAFSLRDGAVSTSLLGQKHTIYEENGVEVTVYTDADGAEIDEAAYNRAAEKAFSDLMAMDATIGWTDYMVSAEMDRLTTEELREVLKTSWKGFAVKASAF